MLHPHTEIGEFARQKGTFSTTQLQHIPIWSKAKDAVDLEAAGSMLLVVVVVAVGGGRIRHRRALIRSP